MTKIVSSMISLSTSTVTTTSSTTNSPFVGTSTSIGIIATSITSTTTYILLSTMSAPAMAAMHGAIEQPFYIQLLESVEDIVPEHFIKK